MHVFLAARDVPGLAPEQLEDELRQITRSIAGLDVGSPWTVRSRSGRTLAIGVHPETHRPDRVYHAAGDAPADEAVHVVFDGLPVARDGGTWGWDADRLRTGWDGLDQALEGAFALLRLDLADDTLCARTDTFGQCRLYVAQAVAGGWVIGTAKRAVGRLAGREALDVTGAATLLAVGWPMGDHTLVEGVRVLPGATIWTLQGRDALPRERRTLAPAQLASVRRGPGPSFDALTEELTDLAGALAGPGGPVACAITSGRDSRACLALLRAAGVDADLYTLGEPYEPDVTVAAELLARLGVPHRVELPSAAAHEDPSALAARFVALSEGQSPFSQIEDVLTQLAPAPRLGVKVSGIGGEAGRVGSGGSIAGWASVGPARGCVALQRWVLRQKAHDHGGVVRAEAVSMAQRAIDAFIDARRSEGWRTAELGEAFYIFERYGRWGGLAVRRTAVTHDLFAPFATRAFVTHCLGLSAGERYSGAVHWRLLSRLDPALRDAPFAEPWHSRRPRAAPANSTAALVREAGRMLSGEYGRARATALLGADWVAENASVHLAAVEEARDSDVFTIVDRERLLGALRGERRIAEGDLRALTLLWSLRVAD